MTQYPKLSIGETSLLISEGHYSWAETRYRYEIQISARHTGLQSIERYKTQDGARRAGKNTIKRMRHG